MLAAGLGTALVQELGLEPGFSTAFAEEGSESLEFGPYDALVDLMQATPAERLQPILIEKIRRGETDLRQLVAAGALANAETFGGEDYVGFHTAMAMLPALQMAGQVPVQRRALPILKVLYRNAQQIQQFGGAAKKTLRQRHAAEEATVENAGLENAALAIRDACRKPDVNEAERLFAPLANAPLDDAFQVLQPVMQDNIDVHRFVFAYRTHGLASLLGPEYAYTILRQCVRFCADSERQRIHYKHPESPIRALLPKLLDEHKLAGFTLGRRELDDAAALALAETIYQGPPAKSADAVAAALAEGISPEVVGEAISLASNLLVLRQGRDRWRAHGDSPGVHASDATNAWRNMARIARPAQAISGLIVAAYHVAAHTPFKNESYPTADHRAALKTTDGDQLLDEAEDAVRHNDQGRAAAAIAMYGEAGGSPEAVCQRMLRYTVSEDGRLHGEKYYQTVQEEFRTTRPAFRWRHLIGLARVTASAFGYDRNDKHAGRAPGYEEACRLLNVTV
jgi:hypothetical protein